MKRRRGYRPQHAAVGKPKPVPTCEHWHKAHVVIGSQHICGECGQSW